MSQETKFFFALVVDFFPFVGSLNEREESYTNFLRGPYFCREVLIKVLRSAYFLPLSKRENPVYYLFTEHNYLQTKIALELYDPFCPIFSGIVRKIVISYSQEGNYFSSCLYFPVTAES